jgi:hypothetical protein
MEVDRFSKIVFGDTWLEAINDQARAEISGGFDEDTDREQATKDYINGMNNVELLELIARSPLN